MERGFSEVVQRALDIWVSTSEDIVADLRADTERFRHLVGLPNMNLMSISMTNDDPFNYRIDVPIESIDQMRDGADTFGRYPDRDYMKNHVVERYKFAREARRPQIHTISATMRGKFVVYDRIILPEKTKKTRSDWAVGISLPRLVLPIADARPKLTDQERVIIDLLILGNATKEIAGRMGMSPKAIEHRLADLRKKFGAKNLVQLATMAASDALMR